MELMMSGVDDIINPSRFVCGLHLRSLVVGMDVYTIKRLTLSLSLVDSDFIPLISRLVAPTLISLELDFENTENHLGILETFFNKCANIHFLSIRFMDIGNDPTDISQSIKDGFNRLDHLLLRNYRGNFKAFVESVRMPRLKYLSYTSAQSSSINADSLTAVAIHCTARVSFICVGLFDSSTYLVEIVKSCRALRYLCVINHVANLFILTRSEVEAIASLPRLERLMIFGIDMEEGALSALDRCGSLRCLLLRGDYDDESVGLAIQQFFSS